MLRGRFTESAASTEWCDRRLLARIHRYTLGRLRREIEPATRAELMRFLFDWQQVRPDDRRQGYEALAAVTAELEGFAAPAAAWEAEILPARIADFAPEMLDRLCLAGRASWARPTPPNRETPGRSFGPIRSTPIALLSRRHAPLWLAPAAGEAGGTAGSSPGPGATTPVRPGRSDPRNGAEPSAAASIRARNAPMPGNTGAPPASPARSPDTRIPGSAGVPPASLSPGARNALSYLRTRGASFFDDLLAGTDARAPDAAAALGELITHGLVSADGFAGLRAFTGASARRLHAVAEAGRWACVPRRAAGAATAAGTETDGVGEAGAETIARTLLRRYGIVFKTLLARESLTVPWRDLLRVLRRLEARGEIRGGRFVAGFTGEQYALPEAVETLRRVRRAPADGAIVALSAADPLNLTGIVTLGDRIPATASTRIAFRDGAPVATLTGARKFDSLEPQAPEQEWAARNALLRRRMPTLSARPA